ncbi:MAG: TolC family protein [Chitinophagaceae bacterium]
MVKIESPPLKLLFLFLCLPPTLTMGQQKPPLTLGDCRQLAVDHYPATRQKLLLSQVTGLQLEGLDKSLLPHLDLSAQATEQSTVTQIPFHLQGYSNPMVSRDQYRADLHLGWLLYDGGATREQKALSQTQGKIRRQELEMTLEQLKTRVDNLFLDILFEQANMNLTRTKIAALQSSLDQVRAGVKQGALLPSEADRIQAAWLQANQDLWSLQHVHQGLLDQMGLLLDTTLDSTTHFVPPSPPDLAQDPIIQRPELSWYQDQRTALRQQSALVQRSYLPRLTLTGDGGYGRPGLNLFNNHFSFYYLAGIQLQVPVWDWKQGKIKRKELDLEQSIISTQKDAFLKDLSGTLLRQRQEIARYRDLMTSDGQLVAIRQRIQQESQSRMIHGALTAHAFIADLEATEEALQNQQIHQLQWIRAGLVYQDLEGK